VFPTTTTPSVRIRRLGEEDDGMSTVEYAIGTIAAAAFAAVLYAVVTHDQFARSCSAISVCDGGPRRTLQPVSRGP
jgi:hypothetical protein